MRLLTVFLALAASVFAEVVEIKGKDKFKELIKKNEFVVTAFTAPWCGHCKKLKPEFEKASAALKGEVVLSNVDATEGSNKDLVSQFTIQGYPTIYIFRNNNADKPIEYEGPRDHQGIVSYLKRMTGPASRLLTDKAAVEKVLASETAVIGVFPGGEKSAEYKTYAEAAGTFRAETDLYHVTDASLLGDHCPKKECKNAKLFVLKKFDEPVLSLELKGAKKDKIEEFIETAITPAVLELSNEPRFKKPVNKVFEDRSTPKALIFAPHDRKEEFRNAIAAAQKTHTHVQLLLVVGADNKGALDFFDLTKDDFPAFTIHQLSPEAKFVDKSVDAASLEDFLTKYKENKLERHIKSEPVPAENAAPVKVVVAKNFEEMVFKSGKDVLLTAYAPWCGHCKKLVPTYEAVAEHYAADPEIMIAKIDATANDIMSDRMDVRGFPTLYFYKHATDEVIKFEGDRSEQSFYDFIEKNRSNPKAQGESAPAAVKETEAHEEL